MASTAAEAIAAKHNSEVKTGHNRVAGAPDGLSAYVARLESLEQQKKDLSEDVRELKKEAKDRGVDPKVLGILVKRQLEDAEKKAKRVALEEKVDEYAAFLSMLS